MDSHRKTLFTINSPVALDGVTVRIFRILTVQVRTRSTLPETNTFAPENGWLEDEILFLGMAYFRCYVSFLGGYAQQIVF